MPSAATELRPSRAREWAKQLAAWLGITALVPLTVWYATAAIRPPPDEGEYDRAHSRLESRINDTKDQAAKDKLYAEKERVEKDHEQAEKAFYRRMFWVAYPVGLLALAIGVLVPVQAVGAGLMFGGIFTLTAGCYSAWDELGRWTHFASLVIALLTLVILGLWRFRPAIS
jgi:hypothetical protein